MTDIEFKLSRKDSYQKDAIFWINLANQREFDFNKHLLSLAAILLPLTASVLALESIKLLQCEKILLMISWVSLGISIISGCIQIWFDSSFFVKLSRDSSAREVIWSNMQLPLSELENRTNQMGKMREKGSVTPLWIQIFALFEGLLLIMFTAASILIRK